MFSPYILARINAAADRMDIVGIEGSRRSAVYAWEPRQGDERFERRTLFVDEAIDTMAPKRVVAAVRATLDALDPEVVCVPGWSYGEALTMLSWARARGRPVVVMSESTKHDAVRVGWRELIKRQILRQCDAALVGGKPQRAYVEALGVRADRTFIGYDAVDNAFFETGAAAARADADVVRAKFGLPERYFLASCRFIEKKNLSRLLDAFAAYRAGAGPDAWSLVLLGDGDLRHVLEAKVAALGLGLSVQFVGFKQYDDLPSLYGLAGGFVHVSTVEQWGLVVNEAMAAGLPVIVSRSCGCADDLVVHQVNGWLVDPLDVADIARRLADLAAPEADRPAMGAQGRGIVADYGPDRFGDGLLAAVNAAVTAPPRAANGLPSGLLNRLAVRGVLDGG
jgi:glycosyltransferase involved in cell wall biosynthesis